MSKNVDVRNSLLGEIKKEKSEDYKGGYVDGVLDMYNGVKPDEQPQEPDYAWIAKELMDKPGMLKALVDNKLRLVTLTDVTVELEMLVKALIKYAGIPGNEVRGKAEKILKFIVEGGNG